MYLVIGIIGIALALIAKFLLQDYLSDSQSGAMIGIGAGLFGYGIAKWGIGLWGHLKVYLRQPLFLFYQQILRQISGYNLPLLQFSCFLSAKPCKGRL